MSANLSIFSAVPLTYSRRQNQHLFRLMDYIHLSLPTKMPIPSDPSLNIYSPSDQVIRSLTTHRKEKDHQQEH